MTSPFEKFVTAYLELVDELGTEKAREALLYLAEVTGVVKQPQGKGRPASNLFPKAAIYAHSDLKKQIAMGDEARMLRRAYRQRKKEHDKAIATLRHEHGLTAEEAEEVLEKALLMTLALESGQKSPQ